MLGDITLWTRVELAKILDRPVEEIDSAYTFARLGIDSGMATHLLIALEEQSQVELDPDVVADLPTIDALCAYAVSLAKRSEPGS